MLFHLPAVIDHQVDRLRNLGNRLETILADFQRQQCGQLKLPLAHQVRGLAHQSDPLLPVPAAPARERRFGCANGLAHFVACSEFKFAQKHAQVCGRPIGKNGAPRFFRPAVDEQGMRLAQLRSYLDHGQIKGLMKVFSQRA